jgi:hypothetical protein
MHRRAVVWLLGPVAWALAGCGQQAEIGAQQSRIIATSDADGVMSAAATILRREFGRVHVHPEGRTIDSEPAEYNTTSQSGTARDLYRGSSTMRRVAHLSVGKRGSETVARLRIDIERQDTARAQNAPPQSAGRFGDSPAETPIQRDAATTDRQNTVWSFVRRDSRLERELLQELEEQFAAAPAAEGATASQPSATKPAGSR